MDANNIAAYHSLLIRTVFLTKLEKTKIDIFLDKKIPLDLDSETENIVKYLFTHYFIITSDEEDSMLKQNCIESILHPIIANTYIITTENCNFRCEYCFISQAVEKSKASKKMSRRVVDATLNLLQKTYEKQNIDIEKNITFYGGEPLLNFDAIRYFMQKVGQINDSTWPSNINYSIITNGSLLNKDHLLFFKENNIGLCISCDFDQPSNAHRPDKYGNCTSATVEKTIQLCREEKVSYGLSITISEDTMKNKEHVINNIIALKPVSVGFNMLLPNKGICVPEAYYEEATNFMIYGFEKLRDANIYEDRIMRKVNAFSNSILYPYDCCACGGNQYVISPDGKIGICHGYLNNRKYFTSNVFNNNFDFESDSVFSYWRKRSPLFMQSCQNCECLSICGGGCAYAADYNNGSIYSLDSRFCTHSKTILKWLINSLFKITTSM